MASLKKAFIMAAGMAALASQGNFGIPKTEIKFAPYSPDKGKTISPGKPKKKPYGQPKQSRKQRKNK